MKQIKRVITDNVPVGLFLVHFETIMGNRCNDGKHEDCLEHGCLDNEDFYIAEIEHSIIQVTENNYLTLPVNVIDKDEKFNSETLWEGDTHDLRPRLFLTEVEAQDHVKTTLNRWNNPAPWEVFVKTA